MADRILVAMSGGVDSSVAAARLKREGWDVVGVTLHLWDYPDDGSARGRCCAPEDVHDARRVADTLGIPHYAFDRRELFARKVIAPFVDGYLAATTPSPCVECNRHVKLRELFALSERLEARYVATGHYARIDSSGPVPRLRRARDPEKDQSYFLHAVTAAELDRLNFPLGECNKADVRAEALALGLPGATKGESQELCFVPTGRYDAFVTARAAGRLRPGPILDEAGRVVGNHDGIHRFTLGQRRNLGVALGHRAYVVEVNADTAAVRLGGPDSLLCHRARVSDVSLADGVRLPFECEAVVRYRGRPHRARVEQGRDGVVVHFLMPASTVVPGQAAVFYSGDLVLGGAIIRSTETDAAVRSTPKARAEVEA